MISSAATSLLNYDSTQELALLLTLLAGLSTVLVYFYFTNVHFRQKGTCSAPVAPAGILLTIKEMTGSNAPWFFKDIAKDIGSDIYRIRLPIPGGFYAVGDPAVARKIFLDKATDKSQEMAEGFSKIMGAHTMFTYSNGDKWHQSRKGTNPAFSSNEVNRMNCICAEHVEKWIKSTLEPCIENNDPFDPSEEMVKITFSVILEAGFEYTATDEEYEHFSKQIEIALREFVFKPIAEPFRKYYGFLFCPKYREALKACKNLQSFSRKILQAYRNKKDEDKSPNNTIIKLVANNKHLVDEKSRVAEILVLLVGGHDTTGYTLGTTLFLLAKHPKVSEKLRSELLGMDTDKWPQSKYLRHVLMESNRLLPVASMGSVRVTGSDISCKNGSIILPKGATVLMPQIICNRNCDLYQDPDAFNPERWEDATKEMRDGLMMFALGKRNCIGQSLAMAELNSTIPKLLSAYKFEVAEEGILDYFLTLKIGGARLKASRI